MFFYSRENELASLEYLTCQVDTKAHLFFITGQRHIGKTTLLKHFYAEQTGFVYLPISKKTPFLLLAELSELLAAKFPGIQTDTIKDFRSLFELIIKIMGQRPIFVVLDDFQNLKGVDTQAISVLKELWEQREDSCVGAFICVCTDQYFMQGILQEFGRATERIHLNPLAVDVVAEILYNSNLDPERHILFYYTLFGGQPEYYALLHKHQLFTKNHRKLLNILFGEQHALLINEGRRLLCDEIRENCRLNSIMQVISSGVTQMTKIAEAVGIRVTSISKYLEELVHEYHVIEHRIPVTSTEEAHKAGRYHVVNPLLRFWFRFIFRNQGILDIGKADQVLNKFNEDMDYFMEYTFKSLARELLLARNDTSIVPFVFSKVGDYWDKNDKITIDCVAVDETGGHIFFCACCVDGNNFSFEEAKQLKKRGQQLKWGLNNRKEYYALISFEEFNKTTENHLIKEGINCIGMKQLISSQDTYANTRNP